MRRRRAFTLIELLVVIAVITILVGILLPALSRARQSGSQTRELAAVGQLGAAYTAYATEQRGNLMPGYLKASWADRGRDPEHEFIVWDHPNDANEYNRLYGSVIRKYPWRIAPYLDFALQALVVDRDLYSRFRNLPDSKHDRYGFQWAFATNPSFGLNTTFVGGDAHRGAFYRPALQRWGNFYTVRLDQTVFADKLLIFASARGPNPQNSTQLVPGNHRVEGPWNANSVSGQVPTFTHWNAPSHWDPNRSDNTYGHLDFRHFARAGTVMFDGHAENSSLSDLNDMRRWSNQATSADWHPQ